MKGFTKIHAKGSKTIYIWIWKYLLTYSNSNTKAHVNLVCLQSLYFIHCSLSLSFSGCVYMCVPMKSVNYL
jgi:hypothetical protein